MSRIYGSLGLAAALISACVASPGTAQERPADVNQIAIDAGKMNLYAQAEADDHRLTATGREKLALRNEAVRLKTADHGTLTAEHRSYLQAKLDQINGS